MIALWGIILIGVIILILYLGLCKKVDEKTQKNRELLREENDLRLSIDHLTDTKAQTEEAILRAQESYKKEIARTNEELIAYRTQKIADQDEFFSQRDKDKEKELSLREQEHQRIFQEKIDALNQQYDDYEEQCFLEKEEWNGKLEDLRQTYGSLIEPLKDIERTKDDIYFRTVQVPEEERADIKFLLTEVLPHLQHPDVLRKLIWTEFFQKPTNEMLKRTEIDESPGIYKITNLETKKCYVGKSTNVKKRLQDHIKGAIGISTISDQKIHREMAKEGIWNFTFERLCFCEKEQLNEKEKYYIAFFDSQNYGYNIASGG